MKKLIATLAILLATTASANTLKANHPFCLTAEDWDTILEAHRANDTRMMSHLQKQQKCGVLKSEFEYVKLSEDENGTAKLRIYLSDETPVVIYTRLVE